MSDSFYTIKKQSQGIYKEKGSRFIGYAIPVENEDEIKIHIERIKKEHYSARHHCYAFIIGHPQHYIRANDDGEPNHSAGDPILRQIQSLSLTNTLVVVVRYFGGTKLGMSGLINAYKSSAAEALRKNEIIEKSLTETSIFFYDYEQTNVVMKIINDYEAEILDQQFQARCKIKARVKLSLHRNFLESLKKANIEL